MVLRESGPRAALLGFAFGCGWFAIVVRWADVVGWDAWVILVCVCAAFISVMAAGLALVARLPFPAVWIAAVWVLQESIRSSVPFGGFPWGRVADGAGTQWASTLSFGGFSFVSFTIVLLAATLVVVVDHAVRARAEARTTVPAITASISIVAAVLLVPVSLSSATDVPSRGEITIAVVQGSVPGEGLDFLGRKRAVLENHVRVTRELAQKVREGTVAQPSLVVWPENSTDIDPRTDSAARSLIEGAVKSVGVPILLGAVLEGNKPTEVLNAAVLWDPVTGPAVVYVKQRPVPFGEYLPLRSQLAPLISRFDRVPRDFAKGTDAGVVKVGKATLGLAICFEVAHDDIQRTTVTMGADLLVVLTNNATYAATDQPDQQFSITRQRSIELGRATVVAATTGITAVVTPTGQVQAQLPTRAPGYLLEKVALTAHQTTAVRAGQGIETGLAIVGLLAVLVGAATRRRRRPGASTQRQEQA